VETSKLHRRRTEFDVLIGGAGIAASAVAVRLCTLGFRPLILATQSRILSGVEAIPESVVPLFEELGMRHILRQSNGLVTEGFENHWRSGDPALRPGRWIHVERARLAAAAVRHAVDCGAVLRLCESIPKLAGSGPICVNHGGMRLSFEAAIDATGRSAVWSRPIRRRGGQVADIFMSSPQASPRGRVVRLSQGWAYRIGSKNSATVAMLGERSARRRVPDVSTRKALGLISEQIGYIGRRPAFPQWSENPIQGRRIAIGDAALAYDPLAGQGIRFALSSAFGASTVINTWRHSPGDATAAERFYLDSVTQSRSRHLRFLDELHSAGTGGERASLLVPEVVIFSGKTLPVDLHVNSRIVSGLAVILADGTPVRWVGGLDLLRIRDLTRKPVRSADLLRQLVSANLTSLQAAALLHWCVRHELVSAASAVVAWRLAETAADNAPA
jgi:flavin-dependent dehydrogenase